MESIWSKTAKGVEHERLSGNISVEAAVIGGGMAGILTAFFLHQKNIKTIVLEASKTGGGQTKNTTAKITSQHNLIYDKLLKDFGEEKAKQYANANQEAIKKYAEIINQQSIDCSFEEMPAYLYSQSQQDVIKLEREAQAAKRLKIGAEFVTQTNLPFPVAGAVKFDSQAQFHPLLFLQAIAKDLTIFENTKAVDVDKNRIITENGTVTADYIIFATHYPFINVPGFYFARMHQERSYVLALKDAQKLDGMYLGVDGEGLSFRNYNDVLLLGGGGHRTGENSAGGKYKFLRSKAAELYPQSSEIHYWSAQDCMTLDDVPYIGQFSPSTPNWYVATGFRKWGMTSSMVSAMIISDAIAGIENPYADVFSPLRFTPSASVKNLAADIGQAVKGLTRQNFTLPKAKLDEIPQGHGGVVEHEGEKIGVYKDENEKTYFVSTRCSHLGCQVEWNPDEKSWDCPCHGSRFDYTGKLLSNPANKDLGR